MHRKSSRLRLAAFAVCVVTAACGDKQAANTAQAAQGNVIQTAAGTGLQPVTNGKTALSPAAIGDSGRMATPADVEFMSGMVHHHAQAIVMANWAPSHEASDGLKRLCERIVVGQGDEIALMRGWLYDHHQPMPDAKATKMKMVMNGKEMDMLMPGMLTDEEMAALDKSRGAGFDRLFLQGMIRHHQGAITMVNKLFGTNGAAQDETVFKFANDVFADQSTEIARMQEMLDAVPKGGANKGS